MYALPEDNQDIVVGLTGYAGSGKDTAGERLIQLGFTRIAFADPLKRVATKIGWDGEKDDYGRRLLQNLGNAVREEIGEDTWVNAGLRTYSMLPTPRRAFFSDVRYPNEVEIIRRRPGGVIVRVDRPGVGPVNDHVSEALDGSEAEYVLRNDGDIEYLHACVDALLAALQA